MKQLTQTQLTKAADELTTAFKCWKVVDGKGDFIVFRVPEPGANVSSRPEGEQMTFWRFDTRTAADRFRNRKIVAELAILPELAA